MAKTFLNNKKVMFKHYPTKLPLFLFLLILPLFMYCMELEKRNHNLKFKPLVLPNDQTLFKNRDECDKNCMNLDNGSIDYQKMHALFPNNTLEVIPKIPRIGVCFNYAMRECLGLSKTQFEQIEQSILGSQDWALYIGMPHTFFDQKQFPQAGDLAVYHDKNNNNSIEHFAKVIGDGRLKSKIGTGLGIIEHNYWDTPSFGEYISFWELQPEYRDQKSKDLLFDEIIKIIQNSVAIKKLLQHAQNTLIAAATNKIYRSPFFPFIKKGNPFHLLQAVMGIKIDLPDDDGNTPLMLAAQAGNLVCLTCLAEHGANLLIKNNDGKDALALAKEYKHQDIIDCLSQHITTS